MKTVCAWCGSPIGINCDHCGAPLLSANYVGCTITTDTAAMLCLNGETPLVYTARAIEAMQVSHGICKFCAALPEDEREALVKARRAIDKSIPSGPDLLNLAREIETANRHERETRAANRAAIHHTAHEKKGSHEVAEKRTPTRPEKP